MGADLGETRPLIYRLILQADLPAAAVWLCRVPALRRPALGIAGLLESAESWFDRRRAGPRQPGFEGLDVLEYRSRTAVVCVTGLA